MRILQTESVHGGMNVDYQIEYYEIEDFWNGVPTESDLERIEKVSELIPPDVTSVLDVGCGNGIFINYLIDHPRKYSILHGVDRSLAALNFVKTEKTQASIENLPFTAGEFDLVACLEVLEHLPKPIYQQALTELTRVSSKYIIVAVPNKQNLELGQIGCPNCFTRFNPDLHLRSFSIEGLKELLVEHSFSCKKVEAICQVENYMMLSKILQWKSKYQHLGNKGSFKIICPICGATIPGNKNIAEENPKSLKNLVKKAWPKTHRKRWLVALYEKN